jgi:hypothetical protein
MFPSTRARILGASKKEKLIHEFREYAFAPAHFQNYMELTCSEAFLPRTRASKLIGVLTARYYSNHILKLSGFWTVETGGSLSRAIHVWEYKDLNHRQQVRRSLAGQFDLYHRYRSTIVFFFSGSWFSGIF